MGQNISYDFEGGHIHEPGFLQKKRMCHGQSMVPGLFSSIL